MKLSILIFVLTTIIYGCQCAPAPGWEEDMERDMQKMEREMHKTEQELGRTFQSLEQKTQHLQEQFEEQMKQAGQLPNNGINGLQDLNVINTNNVGGQSRITISNNVNGNRVDKIIVENVIDNVKYRTETEYTSATDKTEIKKYECTLLPNPQCILKSTEVKDGPPENLN